MAGLLKLLEHRFLGTLQFVPRQLTVAVGIEFFQELLLELLLLLFGSAVLVEAAQVLGALIEIVRAQAEVLREILRGSIQIPVEPVELPRRLPLALELPVELVELTLLALEQIALRFVDPAVVIAPFQLR